MTTEPMNQSMVESQPRFKITLRQISLLVVAFGIVVSGYLSYVKLTDVPMVCAENAGFSCETVQNSPFAEMAGIPIAWLGLATYLVIGALLLFEKRGELMQSYGMLALFGIVFFAFIYSMYLIYVQGVLLQAWCQWCLFHETIITILFVLTSIRFVRHLRAQGELVEDDAV